jgi:hypothetical protein
MASKPNAICLVVFLLFALAASAASAAEFHSEVGNTKLTGEAKNTQVFKPTAGAADEVECKKVSIEGTLGPKTSNEVTFKPKYEECFIEPGHFVATIEFTECAYRVTSETNEIGHAKATLECPNAGEEAHIKVTSMKIKCITLPEQELTGVHYTNTANGGGNSRDIDFEATIGGIDSLTHGLACPPEEVHTSGSYSGRITVRGDNQLLEPIGIWFE